ncbi:MAG: YafY family transcriptional regulator, partial [Bryobacterales bacterium]|nr:YafY family transcriptional regulator [Bryobacterales bacterium]
MRADRLVSILLLLQSNRRLTAGELARRLEVSERTILRDMDALTLSGVPVTAERGVGGGWRLVAPYQTKLNGLTPAEIQSLFIARPPRLLADLGLGAAATAAWIKLQAALPGGMREQAEFVRQRILFDTRGWRDSGEPGPELPVLLDALWRGRQLRFHYERALGDSGSRTVHPVGLVARNNIWYLVTWNEAEHRTYRVSRMREACALEEPAQRPEPFDLAEYWEHSAQEFREQLPRYYAVFRVVPSVMHWVRYKGWRLEEQVPEGEGIRIRVRFDAMVEAVQFALSFGPDLEVLDTEELRQAVADRARAVAAAYSPGGAFMA